MTEQFKVTKGIGKDHHYSNMEGYVLAYSHLFPRKTQRSDNQKFNGLTPEEMTFIIHLCKFDFDNDNDVFPSLPTIAEHMGVSLRSVHNYKDRCVEAGLLIVHSGKKDGSPNIYDLSPLFQFCHKNAIDDGWFKRTTIKPKKEKGMQGVAHLPVQGVAQGGMQDVAHKDTSLEDLSVKESPATPDGAVAYTTIKRNSPEYQSLEPLVKSVIFKGASLGQQGGTILQYLVINQVTPKAFTQFVNWYKAKMPRAELPRTIKRSPKTDAFEGTFVTRFEEWQLDTKAKTKIPTPGSAQPPSPASALPVLSPDDVQANLAALHQAQRGKAS